MTRIMFNQRQHDAEISSHPLIKTPTMKKIYKKPVVQIVYCHMEHLLQNSNYNNINGTIHSDGIDEKIVSGKEEDEEGTVASSKSSPFFMEW